MESREEEIGRSVQETQYLNNYGVPETTEGRKIKLRIQDFLLLKDMQCQTGRVHTIRCPVQQTKTDTPNFHNSDISEPWEPKRRS